MNIANFIFRLFHIPNLLTLAILTPPCLPCTPSYDCAHLFVDYVYSFANYDNKSTNCADFSADYAHKFYDWVNTLDD